MSDLEHDIGPERDTYPPGYVAKLVHELRTPLTALRGSLGLLASVVDDATPEVRNFATIAERNAAKLAGMLDDLAELERLRSRSLVAAAEHVDLADLTDAAVTSVQRDAAQRGVSIEPDLEAGNITADPEILRSLLTRVLEYAIRMSSPGSVMRVRTRHDDDSASVEISDGGRPVAPEKAEEVFDPFSLVARRGQDGSARPGLGLAIARAQADLLGATLTFASGTDGGRFTLVATSRGPGTGDLGPVVDVPAADS